MGCRIGEVAILVECPNGILSVFDGEIRVYGNVFVFFDMVQPTGKRGYPFLLTYVGGNGKLWRDVVDDQLFVDLLACATNTCRFDFHGPSFDKGIYADIIQSVSITSCIGGALCILVFR